MLTIWITDKTRQFYDGIFYNNNLKLTDNNWSKIFKNLTQNLYIFNICVNQLFYNYFFTIVFENLSLEILSLLNLISQNYSFIKVKRVEKIKINNDLEANFQLNSISNKTKLNNSEICLLISTNTRYQGYRLNLNLRQRFFKGNFKCILMGSFVDLTFPLVYVGSNLKITNDIVRGNNFNCQDLIESKDPLVVINDDLLKRNDELYYSLNTLKFLKNINSNTEY